MPAVTQTEGLVRGADGVLYNVSPETCEPVPEIRGDLQTDGTGGVRDTVDGSSEYAAGRMFVEPDDHAAGRKYVEPDDQVAVRAQ